jgi:hypothetical protein
MNNWHFGWFASLEFTTGAPIVTSGSSMISIEGCVSYSDGQGNLLFYSNGGSNDGSMLPAPGGVWNKNHQMMPNGAFNHTMGSMSAAQSSLVIPKSGTEYYLFTMGAGNGTNLRYCIVDMALDGGLGDVTNMATILLDDPGTNLHEGLVGTRHANGIDYWLTVHGIGNEYFTYLVNASGISAPLIQTIGSASGWSSLKFSVQGDKLLTSQELFDFDNSTGTLSNPYLFSDGDLGHAFSSSGRYVYRIQPATIEQYDITVSNIQASEVTVGASGPFYSGTMQLGPDLKLYVANLNHAYLSVFNEPNLPGAACSFVADQVDLVGVDSKLGLPNFIDSELATTNSIEEFEDVEVNVFPNPTHGDVSISTPVGTAIETIEVISISGQYVAEYTYAENLSLDVDQGTYILIFKANGVPVSRTRVVLK